MNTITVNGQSLDEFVAYLEQTLIPDLRESGHDYTAEDFETCVKFMRALVAGLPPEPERLLACPSCYVIDTLCPKCGLCCQDGPAADGDTCCQCYMSCRNCGWRGLLNETHVIEDLKDSPRNLDTGRCPSCGSVSCLIESE